MTGGLGCIMSIYFFVDYLYQLVQCTTSFPKKLVTLSENVISHCLVKFELVFVNAVTNCVK